MSTTSPVAASARGRLRRLVSHPALLVLVIAPVFGEGLSGSTPPLHLLLPWNFAFMAALYGCGALVCREVAHRCSLGFAGLCLLGAAYGIWEEAFVDRYWFDPTFWTTSGVGTYAVVWHTNVLLAVHLTAFHAAISVCSSVAVVEWLVPTRRDRPWTSRPGLAVAAIVLAATPVVYGELDRHPPVPVLVAAAALLVGVVLAAFVVGRRRTPTPRPAGPPRRGVGLVAFGAALAHWVAVYGIARTSVPWPLGVLIALAPVAAGVLAVRRLAVTGPYGSDGIRVVAGLLVFFGLLDLVVGLMGPYDTAVGGLLALAAAYGLRRSARAPCQPPSVEGE